jgi:hypothetical protein
MGHWSQASHSASFHALHFGKHSERLKGVLITGLGKCCSWHEYQSRVLNCQCSDSLVVKPYAVLTKALVDDCGELETGLIV